MVSLKNFRLVGSAASLALLSLVSASSEGRGRSVRSDDSDTAFNALGGFWGTNNQFGAPGFSVRTEFKLRFNPANPPRFFTVCMSEEGFLKLITADTCADSDFALPPTGNYIAVFATNLDSFSSGFGSLIQARGFVDRSAPFKLWQTDPAMRFWWSGVIIDGDPGDPGPPPTPPTAFDVQVVLIDRSNGNNNGNFDIEFNYGDGDQIPPVGTESLPNANGFQGFKLGPNSVAPTFGPFGPFDTTGDPIRFCFRGGTLQSSC